MEAAGIAPAAPVYQVVLTIASVEPLVSGLFSVTLTPAVPAYLACVGPTTPTGAGQPYALSHTAVVALGGNISNEGFLYC